MKIILPVLCASILLACKGSVSDKAKEAEQRTIDVAINYTRYGDSTELYLEHSRLSIDQPALFTAHISDISGNHKPLKDALVEVSLIVGNKGIKNAAAATAIAGIYSGMLRPASAGAGTIVVSVLRGSSKQTFTIDSVLVSSGNQSSDGLVAGADGSLVNFPKEQAWQSEFAVQLVGISKNRDVLRATGELMLRPGDETVISSRSAGIVKILSPNLVEGAPVSAGTKIFAIAGDNVVTGNIDEDIKLAQLEFDQARVEYERLAQLIEDKLVLRSEYTRSKLALEAASLRLKNLRNNYGASGKIISSPITGHVKQMHVNDGDYVTDGQRLAVLFKNGKILLKADLPIAFLQKFGKATEADFQVSQSSEVFNTTKLNGSLIATAKSAAPDNSFVPVFFELNNPAGLLPGSRATVYLKSENETEGILLPLSALLEEHGSYYVYVQKGGEQFEKRNVKTVGSDATHVRITEGIVAGERVVTTGAFRIKLASQSTVVPAHDHDH